jgi:hypothetical protein
LDTRRYAFGAVPIGDAFPAWSKSARPWVAPEQTGPARQISCWWLLPLLTLFLAVGAAPWPAVAAWRRRSRRVS